MTRQRNHTRRRQRGAAAIEFALVFVLFFMLLYGAIAYGVLFAVRHSLTQAASEGARAALQDVGGLPERIALAEAAATNAVSWMGDQAPTLEVRDVTEEVPCSFTCLKVKLTYNYAENPIIPPIPGLGINLPANLAAEATVQLDAVI